MQPDRRRAGRAGISACTYQYTAELPWSFWVVPGFSTFSRLTALGNIYHNIRTSIDFFFSKEKDIYCAIKALLAQIQFAISLRAEHIRRRQI